MSHWQRIILVTFALIGSAGFFGYWSLNQFNDVLDNLSSVNFASPLPAYPSARGDADLTSSSTEASIEFATSTLLELSLSSPKKDEDLYSGCVYPINWQSSTTVNFIEIALIDAGTGEAAGPITSGLAKENTIKAGVQNLSWKVGLVWPGKYYLRTSKVNKADIETKSAVFNIKKIPANADGSQPAGFCPDSPDHT